MTPYLEWWFQNLKQIITNHWRVFAWNRFSISYLDRYFHIKGLASVIYNVIIVLVTAKYAKNISQYKYLFYLQFSASILHNS